MAAGSPRLHSEIAYRSGRVECDGELVTAGRQGEWEMVVCRKCHAQIAIPAAAGSSQQSMRWQERRDLA